MTNLQDFEKVSILKQGLLESFVIDLPKISLHFSFPKRFEINFIRVEDYRATLPIFRGLPVMDWWTKTDSDFIASITQRRLRDGAPPRNDTSDLRHFHMAFSEGNLDVLAEDFVFMMLAK